MTDEIPQPPTRSGGRPTGWPTHRNRARLARRQHATAARARRAERRHPTPARPVYITQ